MLNFQTAINDQKKFSEIKLNEISPIRKLILRGKSREFYLQLEKQLIYYFQQNLIPLHLMVK
jgi:hypothetical protein